LDEILRIGADVEDSQSEGVDERGVAVVEPLEGITIAARDLLDQTGRVVPPLGTHANFVSQAARREQEYTLFLAYPSPFDSPGWL